jgi:hypothetical protein
MSCFLVGNGSVNSSATKGVVEDPHKVACLQAVQIPVCYLAPIVALCMRPVGTSDSLRGQIEGDSPLLQQMQKVLMHLTYRGY